MQTCLSLASDLVPFVTLRQSDFDGPVRRERCVLRGTERPAWLEGVPHLVRPGFTTLVAAMGREPGSIRVERIVVYPKRGASPSRAFVYVREVRPRPREPRHRTAPFHVVQCRALPEQVSFVELNAT